MKILSYILLYLISVKQKMTAIKLLLLFMWLLNSDTDDNNHSPVHAQLG